MIKYNLEKLYNEFNNDTIILSLYQYKQEILFLKNIKSDKSDRSDKSVKSILNFKKFLDTYEDYEFIDVSGFSINEYKKIIEKGITETKIIEYILKGYDFKTIKNFITMEGFNISLLPQITVLEPVLNNDEIHFIDSYIQIFDIKNIQTDLLFLKEKYSTIKKVVNIIIDNNLDPNIIIENSELYINTNNTKTLHDNYKTYLFKKENLTFYEKILYNIQTKTISIQEEIKEKYKNNNLYLYKDDILNSNHQDF